jgi:hypothetical protein
VVPGGQLQGWPGKQVHPCGPGQGQNGPAGGSGRPMPKPGNQGRHAGGKCSVNRSQLRGIAMSPI